MVYPGKHVGGWELSEAGSREIEAQDIPERPRIAVVPGLKRICGSHAFCLQGFVTLACVDVSLQPLYLRQLLALIFDDHGVGIAIKRRSSRGRCVVCWLEGV